MSVPQSPVQRQKIALVTGGARRIGAVLAQRLAAQGYRIALHARAEDEAVTALVTSLQASGGKVVAFYADLAAPEARKAFIARVYEAFGPLDLLVNNAAYFVSDTFEAFDDETFDAHLSVNLKAPIDLARQFAKQASSDDPSIINIIDHRVLKLTPQHFTYTLSKAALYAATTTMAQALAPHIRVNAIGPGPVFPNPRDGDRGFSHEVSGVPLHHAVSADEIASAVLYLAGARSVTGTLLPVDAGQAIGWKTPDIVGA